MSWYFVGPDKTGFDCPDCCAGFYVSFGSCQLHSCIPGSSTSVLRRNYVCPSTAFPSPFHYYYRNPATGNVSISRNPIKCPGGGPAASCGSFYPPLNTLNSGGRYGSGCSQEWVNWISGECQNTSAPCSPPPGGCDTCGLGLVGAIIYFQSCSFGGVCACESAGFENTCSCSCISPQFGPNGDLCCDPTGENEDCACCDPAIQDCGGCPCERTCPDGSKLCTCDQECGCDGSPIPECGPCEYIFCGEGAQLECLPSTCPDGCPAGFSCSCGACVCNTSSTCCTGDQYGYTFIASTKECRPCTYGFENVENPEACCATYYDRAACDDGEICCNDGRCYTSDTTLCTPAVRGAAANAV